MKRLALTVLILALSLAAAPAVAETAAAAPGTLKLPVQLIYGRPDKPQVCIVVKTPTAAAAAGAAHESLRAAMLGRSEPGPLRAP